MNRGHLALLLWQQYEFPFGIDIVQFSIFNFFLTTISISIFCIFCHLCVCQSSASILFYIDSIFALNGMMVSCLFAISWLLTNNWIGGILTAALFMVNRYVSLSLFLSLSFPPFLPPSVSSSLEMLSLLAEFLLFCFLSAFLESDFLLYVVLMPFEIF